MNSYNFSYYSFYLWYNDFKFVKYSYEPVQLLQTDTGSGRISARVVFTNVEWLKLDQSRCFLVVTVVSTGGHLLDRVGQERILALKSRFAKSPDISESSETFSAIILFEFYKISPQLMPSLHD